MNRVAGSRHSSLGKRLLQENGLPTMRDNDLVVGSSWLTLDGVDTGAVAEDCRPMRDVEDLVHSGGRCTRWTDPSRRACGSARKSFSISSEVRAVVGSSMITMRESREKVFTISTIWPVRHGHRAERRAGVQVESERSKSSSVLA